MKWIDPRLENGWRTANETSECMKAALWLAKVLGGPLAVLLLALVAAALVQFAGRLLGGGL